MRVASFVSGGAVPAARRGLKLGGASAYVHISDWYATFCGLAGVDADDDGGVDTAGTPLPKVDGLDMWPFLTGGAVASPRTTIPFTMGHHQPGCGGSIINGTYKLLLGTQSPAFWNGPEYPNGTRPSPISVDCGAGCLYDVSTATAGRAPPPHTHTPITAARTAPPITHHLSLARPRS